MVLQKLRWYETSDRQWRDVVSVLRAVGSRVDATYLDTVDIGALRTLLDRARSEAARA